MLTISKIGVSSWLHKVWIGKKLWISDESNSLSLNRIQSSFINFIYSIYLVFFRSSFIDIKKGYVKEFKRSSSTSLLFRKYSPQLGVSQWKQTSVAAAMTWLQPCEWNSVESWLHSWTSWFCKFLRVLLHKLIIDDRDVILIFRIEHSTNKSCDWSAYVWKIQYTCDNPIIKFLYSSKT